MTKIKKFILAVSPVEAALILNKQVDFITRNFKPNCKLPCEVFIYCKKEMPYLFKDNHFDNYYISFDFPDKDQLFDYTEYLYNNYILAKFTLNYISSSHNEQLSELLDKYSDKDKKALKGTYLYDWHIDNLEIFETAKSLKELKVKKMVEDTCFIKNK